MTYKISKELLKQCKNCGINFHLLNPHQEFCDEKCKREYNLKLRRQRYISPLEKRTMCLHCGKVIDSYGSQKFCSIQCRNLHRNKIRNKTGRINNKIIKPNILKKCVYCGKDIPWIKERSNSYKNRKFCSKECCANYFKEHKEDFIGRQINNEEFKIVVINTKSGFIWKALKNGEVVLKSDKNFNNYKICLKDAYLAIK